MGFVIYKTTFEERKNLLTNESFIEVVKKSGGSELSIGVERNPKFLFVNKNENACFCLLQTGGNRDSDGKSRYLIKINDEYIIFEIKGYNTVNFLHNSPSLNLELPKVK